MSRKYIFPLLIKPTELHTNRIRQEQENWILLTDDMNKKLMLDYVNRLCNVSKKENIASDKTSTWILFIKLYYRITVFI